MIKLMWPVTLVLIGLVQASSNDTAANNTTAANKSCLALALSGGGAKGAYEAGALYGLVMNAPDKTQFAYDVVTGVSAGAINTAAISMFAKGNEVSLVQFLSDTWASINDGTVYQNWSPLGIVTGLLSYSGIFDDSPLEDFLHKVLNEFGYKIQRKLAISCVDVVTGEYIIFNETVSDPVKAVVSSASIPLVFPFQPWPDTSEFKDVICMDGGTVWNTNLVSAIQRCEEQVDDHSQITVDIIICSDYHAGTWKDQNNAYNNFMLSMEIKDAYTGLYDVYEIMNAYPKVNYRYFLQPSQPLPGGVAMINFDNTTSTWPMQMLGRLDAENAIKDGSDFMFNKIRFWRDSPALQSEFPLVNDYITYTVKERAQMYAKERRQMGYEDVDEYGRPLKKEQSTPESTETLFVQN